MFYKNLHVYLELTESEEVTSHFGIDMTQSLMVACVKIKSQYMKEFEIEEFEVSTDDICIFLDRFLLEFKNRVVKWFDDPILVMANYGSKRKNKLDDDFKAGIDYDGIIKNQMILAYKHNVAPVQLVSMPKKKTEKVKRSLVYRLQHFG